MCRSQRLAQHSRQQAGQICLCCEIILPGHFKCFVQCHPSPSGCVWHSCELEAFAKIDSEKLQQVANKLSATPQAILCSEKGVCFPALPKGLQQAWTGVTSAISAQHATQELHESDHESGPSHPLQRATNTLQPWIATMTTAAKSVTIEKLGGSEDPGEARRSHEMPTRTRPF